MLPPHCSPSKLITLKLFIKDEGHLADLCLPALQDAAVSMGSPVQAPNLPIETPVVSSESLDSSRDVILPSVSRSSHSPILYEQPSPRKPVIKPTEPQFSHQKSSVRQHEGEAMQPEASLLRPFEPALEELFVAESSQAMPDTAEPQAQAGVMGSQSEQAEGDKSGETMAQQAVQDSFASEQSRHGRPGIRPPLKSIQKRGNTVNMGEKPQEIETKAMQEGQEAGSEAQRVGSKVLQGVQGSGPGEDSAKEAAAQLSSTSGDENSEEGGLPSWDSSEEGEPGPQGLPAVACRRQTSSLHGFCA